MLNPETFPSEVTSESLYAGTFTSNTNATGVDLTDYIGKLKVVLNAAAAADNNQAVSVELQESDELAANYTAIASGLQPAALIANAAASLQELEVDTRANKKYLRAVLTESAAGNGRAVSITLCGKKQITA